MPLPSPSVVVLGLGANLGQPLETMRRAAREIALWGSQFAASSLYRTAAVGPPQPDYLNAAVRVSLADSATELLARCHALESAEGRIRAERWGPRTLDVDVLWIEGLRVGTPTLQVPHLHLITRAFALMPLLDVAPEAIDPRTGRRFSECLDQVRDQRIVQVADGSWADVAEGVAS